MAKNKKRKLTPLQLHKIRVRAGKKAAKTLKKRMKEEPEFRAYMQEVYKKAGERLKQYNKQKRKEREADIDYDFTDEEYDTFTDQETLDDYNDDLSDEELDEVQQLFFNLADTLSSSVNQNTADYLIGLLHDNIPRTKEGQKEYASRILNESDELLDRAEKVAYDSDGADKADIRESAHALAKIIAGDNYSPFVIDKCIEEDFSYEIRKKRHAVK